VETIRIKKLWTTRYIKWLRMADITSTRRPIIYPSGKIIAHDSRYKHLT